MDINRLNYEAYLIDYIEGQLTTVDKAAFDAFLMAHPNVAQEIDMYRKAPLLTEPEKVFYERKKNSKKRRQLVRWLPMLLILIGLTVWSFSHFQKLTSEQIQSKNPQKKVLPSVQSKKKIAPPIQPKVNKKIKAIDRRSLHPIAQAHKIAIKQMNTKREVKDQSIHTEHNTAEQHDNIPMNVVVNQARTLKVIAPTDKMTPLTEVSAPRKPNNQINPVENIAASILKPLNDKQRKIELVLVHIPKKRKKSTTWKKLLTPQSYKDSSLSESFAFTNLKSAVKDNKDAIVPELLIKK